MAEGVQIDVIAGRYLADYRHLSADVQAGVVRGLKRGLILAEGRVRTGAGITARRGSAGLLGRLTSRVVAQGVLGLDGAIGFRKSRGYPYEYAQEFGAKAMAGGAMSIPVSKEAKLLSEREGKGARAFPRDLFIPAGTHVLAESIGKRGTGIKVHYVLVKSIPPRLKFRENVVGSIPEIGVQVVKGAQEATA